MGDSAAATPGPSSTARTATTASGPALETILSHSAPAEIVFVSDCESAFCQRTWMALEHRRIPYRYREATEAEKTADETAWTPQALLPFFEVDGQTVVGSVNLIQFLEDAFPHLEPRLMATQPVERARQRIWTEFARKTLTFAFTRVSRSNQDALQDAARVELCKALDTFSDQVVGPFFSGQEPALPDMTLAPFVARARRTGAPDLAAGKRYQEYSERLLALECLKRTSPAAASALQAQGSHSASSTRFIIPRLPPELIAHILNFVGDYELAKTLGWMHDLPETTPWQEQATPLDHAILTGSLAVVKTRHAAGHRIFSQWGSRVMLRFSYTHLLEWLHETEPAQLHRLCDYLLPEVASAWGRVGVLEWALRSGFGLPRHLSESPIDEASRNGHVETLEWWRRSGLPLVYSEHALNSATIKRQIGALEWWRTSGLRLEIGKVLDFASMEGSTAVLDWWIRSGLEGNYSKTALYHVSCAGNVTVLDWWGASRLPLLYDKDVLVGSTKHGQVKSLDWWADSGLPVYYTFFDIEEALEDCIGQREAVEAWWAQRGLHEGNATDWTRQRLLRK